ncbi:Uncharacterised protein [Neisseria meningitidis]|nr:Uncharacterised protein [Neisseria meningitidis]
MNMKKWIAAALACSALALSACGGQGKDPPRPPQIPTKCTAWLPTPSLPPLNL